MPSLLALFAHPDDIEFVAAGTMLQLAQRGWKLHYMNLCSGSGGSVQMDGATTAATRLGEAQEAARLLGATHHAPICDDLELVYSPEYLRRVVAVVREVRPSIVLTHSPSDYMEDHMAAARLAVTAAFARGVMNFHSTPLRPAYYEDAVVYHAMPHGLRDPLGRAVRAGLYVDTAPVHAQKREALAAHRSQRDWLDRTQGMGSYVEAMEEMARAVGRLSGRFELAEGWRKHLHLGFSAQDADPLAEALGAAAVVDAEYAASLAQPL